MLRHILPKLLDGQLRSVNVASLGQASRERIELRRLWRWNRLRLALFIYHLSELTISVQIVKLYPYCCAFSLVNHSMEAGAALVMYAIASTEKPSLVKYDPTSVGNTGFLLIIRAVRSMEADMGIGVYCTLCTSEPR